MEIYGSVWVMFGHLWEIMFEWHLEIFRSLFAWSLCSVVSYLSLASFRQTSIALKIPLITVGIQISLKQFKIYTTVLIIVSLFQLPRINALAILEKFFNLTHSVKLSSIPLAFAQLPIQTSYKQSTRITCTYDLTCGGSVIHIFTIYDTGHV